MNSEKTGRFLAAMEILAAAESDGLRMFRVRARSTCVGEILGNEDGSVALRSLVGLEGAANGRAYALSSICYLADVFDVCLTADERAVFRDVGGDTCGCEWLARFGFMRTRDGDRIRLPRSLHHQQAA